MSVLSRIDGLKPVTPQGAMYLMLGIEVEKFKDIETDVDFSAKLLAEENVVCLPGEVRNQNKLLLRCTYIVIIVLQLSQLCSSCDYTY